MTRWPGASGPSSCLFVSTRDAPGGAGRSAPVPTVARLCHPRAMDRPGDLEDLTLTERRWRELAPPEVGASARVLYERVARWSSGNLPGVDVPYDPRQEHHWYYAALIEDFASHLPPSATTGWSPLPRVLDLGPGDGWPSIPLAQRLPDALLLGVDPSPRRVAVSCSNAARLGVSNASF